jgi:hypothetical protein
VFWSSSPSSSSDCSVASDISSPRSRSRRISRVTGRRRPGRRWRRPGGPGPCRPGSRCRRAGCRPGPWRRRAGRRRSGARGPSGPGSRPSARTGGRWRRRGSGPAFRGAPRGRRSGWRARRPGRWRRWLPAAPARWPRRPPGRRASWAGRGRGRRRRGGPGAGPSGRPGRGCARPPWAFRSRGGCGSTARLPIRLGPSPENTTSRSGVSASERAACARARLKGSVGLSGLEAMAWVTGAGRRTQGTPCGAEGTVKGRVCLVTKRDGRAA